MSTSMIRKTSLILAAAGAASGLSSHASAAGLTVETATAIVAPFYEALNQPAYKDVAALLERSTSPEWVSCGNNDACLPRDAIVNAFKARGVAIPDLRWRIVDVIVAGNTAIVRGEASGTPVAPFNGAPATGRSFRVMSIDVHTIENDRMVRSYHVEDWAGAARQLGAQ